MIHRSLTTVILVCSFLLLSLLPAAADEWNEVFDQPRYFETAQGVHLRARPTTNSAIVTTLKGGTPLQSSGIEEGWHKGRTADGDEGYVYKSFLRPLPGPPPGFADAGAHSGPVPEQKPVPEPAPAPAPVPEPEPAPVPEPEQTPAVETAPAPTPSVIDEEPLVDPVAPPPTEAIPGPADEPGAEPLDTPPAEPTVEPLTREPAPAPQPAPPSDPVVTEGADCKRIRFQPGAVSGSLERALPAGDQHCYQLSVSENQWMEVWLTSVLDNAVFQIYSPTGVSVTAGETHWLGRTESTGDYIILVTSLDGMEAAYNLKIQIK